MDNNLQMDWIDGVLIAASFGLYILLDIQFSIPQELGKYAGTSSIFWGPAIRRIIFGPPNLPEPKIGAIWRLASVFGLLTIFFSIGMFALSGLAIQQSKEPMPDFRQEVEQRHAELQSDLSSINAMIDAVVVPVGTPKEEIQRLEAKRKKERERKEKLEVEQRIQKLEREYKEDKEERYQEGIDLMKWSAMVCFIGSFLLRIRYPS